MICSHEDLVVMSQKEIKKEGKIIEYRENCCHTSSARLYHTMFTVNYIDTQSASIIQTSLRASFRS